MDFNFGSFLGGAADAGKEDLSKRRDYALNLKLQSRLIEQQLEKEKQLEDYKRLSPQGTSYLGSLSGAEGGNIYGPGQRVSAAEGGLLGGLQKAQIGARAKASSRPTIKGAMIMNNLPNGQELGLDPEADYPIAMANFATSATRMGMGTADMRNQLTSISSFEKNVESLKAKYDSFEPGNPLIKTAEEKWASLLKGYSPTGNRTAMEASSDLKHDVALNADNADIADMLTQRINLAMEYARATNGSRPSDKDFENALKVIPAYSADEKLRNLRFESLSSNATNKREAVYEQAPKLKPKQESRASAGEKTPNPHSHRTIVDLMQEAASQQESYRKSKEDEAKRKAQ